MFSIFRRGTPFQRALERYGHERCSTKAGQLWIGLGPSAGDGRAALEAAPVAPQSVLFLAAPEQAELVAALGESPEARTLGHLMIGTSHDYARAGGPTPYEMGAAVAAFGAARWPGLRSLSLGAMEQLFNGNVYLGRLGEVTPVFDAAPVLETLDLNGCFALARPVRHEALTELTVTLDDIGVSGGPLTQESVNALLGSQFPRLRSADLDLEEESAPLYAIPEAFFTGDGFPALERLAMNTLEPEAEARLAAWKAARAIGW